MKAAVVAAIQLAVGSDRQPVGAAAGGRDDLLAAAGPAAGDAPLLDLDHDDAAVVHDDRRLGKAQSVGDQFELHPHLPCPRWFPVLSRPSCPFAHCSPHIFTKPTSATPICSRIWSTAAACSPSRMSPVAAAAAPTATPALPALQAHGPLH